MKKQKLFLVSVLSLILLSYISYNEWNAPTTDFQYFNSQEFESFKEKQPYFADLIDFSQLDQSADDEYEFFSYNAKIGDQVVGAISLYREIGSSNEPIFFSSIANSQVYPELKSIVSIGKSQDRNMKFDSEGNMVLGTYIDEESHELNVIPASAGCVVGFMNLLDEMVQGFGFDDWGDFCGPWYSPVAARCAATGYLAAISWCASNDGETPPSLDHMLSFF